MEINTFALQQLLAGEELFLIKDVIVVCGDTDNGSDIEKVLPLSVSPLTTTTTSLIKNNSSPANNCCKANVLISIILDKI